MKESKSQKIERVAHLVASSWLDTSERVLSRNESNWKPGKLSELSSGGMAAMTSEYSISMPWDAIKNQAVAMAKMMIAMSPEKYPLTINYFSKKS